MDIEGVMTKAAHKRVLGQAKDSLRKQIAAKEAAIAERDAKLTGMADEVASLRSKLDDIGHEVATRDTTISGLTKERDTFKAALGEFQKGQFDSVLAQIDSLPEAQRDGLKGALADEIERKDGAAIAKKLPAFLKLIAPGGGKTGSEPLKSGQNGSEPRFQGKPVSLLQAFNAAALRGTAEEQSKAAADLGMTVPQATSLLNRFDAAKK